MSVENQVHLTGERRQEEERAADAISPGYLVELDSDGKVIPHSIEGGYAERMYAEADFLQGKTLDNNYADGDLVFLNMELPGNDHQAFLKVDENVVIGQELISAGDGTLIALGSEDSLTTVRQVIAYAREALDLTGSGAVTKLMKVRSV